jgi:hypothetical protein
MDAGLVLQLANNKAPPTTPAQTNNTARQPHQAIGPPLRMPLTIWNIPKTVCKPVPSICNPKNNNNPTTHKTAQPSANKIGDPKFDKSMSKPNPFLSRKKNSSIHDTTDYMFPVTN